MERRLRSDAAGNAPEDAAAVETAFAPVRPEHCARTSRDVAALVSRYRPKMPDAAWEPIAPFVRAAVTDATPHTVYGVKALLSTLSHFARWCTETAGLELDRAVVFDRYVIEEFIVKGCPGLNPASRGNRRSQLLRMAESLLGPDRAPGALNPLRASDPQRPYTEAQIGSLRSWASGQGTPGRRRDASTLLALGLGAGLAAEDIRFLTASMVHRDAHGVVIDVPGRRPRLVPVIDSWSEPILEAARTVAPERPLFRPDRGSGNKNFVGQFVHASNGAELKPSIQRLRVTWIVWHLDAGTPVLPFLEAAGVGRLGALTRYLRFVKGIDPDDARRRLQGQLPGGSQR